MILFTSNRPLERAENIRAVFDAYDGDKEFVQLNPWHYDSALSDSKYRLRITDEFVWLNGLKTVMIGHGINGGKRYGADQPRPYHSRERGKLIAYAIATSEAMRNIVAHQSGVSLGNVLPLGMPRTDAYFGVRKGDGGTFLAKKRAYLYAPTYRNANEPTAPVVDWAQIDKHLSDDEVLVVKAHMNSERLLDKEYKHIVEVSKDEPSTPYLIDCDVLVTDYSSIMLDAHVLGKPVVLYEKETGYVSRRGMYLCYPEEYASRYCTDECGLVSELRAADKPQEADIRCRERTAGACDGRSSERVVQLIKEII